MQGHTVLICYYLLSTISGFIPWSISSFIISPGLSPALLYPLDYRGRDSRVVVWHLHIQSIPFITKDFSSLLVRGRCTKYKFM